MVSLSTFSPLLFKYWVIITLKREWVQCFVVIMGIKMNKVRSKKCKICANGFTPQNSLQKCCSMDCALIFARQGKAEAEQKVNNKRRKAFREENKTLNNLTQEAQAYGECVCSVA